MGLETATYISDLTATNPLAGDAKSQGDDHIRLLKSTLQATFPNITGAVTPTHTELNYVDGVTSSIQTQLNTIVAAGLPTMSATTNGRPLLNNGSAAAWESAWATKTTTYTAVAGDRLLCNTTSAAFTVTLPATPAAGDRVTVKDYANTWATNNLTIGRNSTPIENSASDWICDISGQCLVFEYVDSTKGWAVL